LPSAGRSPSREKKSKLRPSLVYQPSRMPEIKNACDSLRWCVVEWWGMLLRQRKVDKDVANPTPMTPYFLPPMFRHIESQNASIREERKETQNRPRTRGIANRENAETKSKKAKRPWLRHWRYYRPRTGSRPLSPPFTLYGGVRTAAINLAGEWTQTECLPNGASDPTSQAAGAASETAR